MDRPQNRYLDDENVVENYTPEIPTDEDGYDGGTADDSGADNVVAGNSVYWENSGISYDH